MSGEQEVGLRVYASCSRAYARFLPRYVASVAVGFNPNPNPELVNPNPTLTSSPTPRSRRRVGEQHQHARSRGLARWDRTCCLPNPTACRPLRRAGSMRCRARSCSALRCRQAGRIGAVCGGAWARARRVGLRDAAGPRHLAHVRGLPRGCVPQLWPGGQWCARSCWRFSIRRTVNSAAVAVGRPFWCLGRVRSRAECDTGGTRPGGGGVCGLAVFSLLGGGLVVWLPGGHSQLQNGFLLKM